jgi:IMP cyclohydrolase
MNGAGDLISANAYPGRGMVVARTLAGVAVCYFVTGRSPASRDRRLRLTDEGDLVVEPVDTSDDDPLRHYIAATMLPGWIVVGNGRQVGEVATRIDCGMAPEAAMSDLEHEPDEPIFTDRITAVVARPEGRHIVFGVARRSLGARTSSNILTFSTRNLAPGDALLLTTYRSDGKTIEGDRPVFEARCDAADAATLLDLVWTSLDPAYRVAAASIAVNGDARGIHIRNQH